MYTLCQVCGLISDSGNTHACNPAEYAGNCAYCDHYGHDLRYDMESGNYYHRDPFQCIMQMREELNHTGGHCLENDDRFTKIENTLTAFVEGRRAAVEGTKEKHHKAQQDEMGEGEA